LAQVPSRAHCVSSPIFTLTTMGYGGYAPGANSRMQGPQSDFEQALRGLPLDKADDTLDILDKLTRNVVRVPKEEKFRKIKLTNKKIMELITEVDGAVTVLREMGWVDSGEDEPTLILPESVTLAFEVHVVKIIEARDYYKKERENEKRRQHREERDAADPSKQVVREQMEADARERATRGPAQASVAQKLNDGPRIVRAADLGIGKSSGG